MGAYYPLIYKPPANTNCVCLSGAPENSELGFYCSAEPAGVRGIPDTNTTTSSTTSSTTKLPVTTVPQYSCVCPEIYQPVCGVDNKSYENICQATCKNIQVKHEGECTPQDTGIILPPEEKPGIPSLPQIPDSSSTTTTSTTRPIMCIAL